MAYPHQADRHHLRPTRLLSLKRASGFHTQGCLISALQRVASPVTLPCGALLPEPAITQLDWSFAPMPKSEEPIALEYPFGPPWTFRYTSSCSGIDHWVSGRILVTTGAFNTMCLTNVAHYCFRFVFVVEPLKLATKIHSPARVSRRIMRPCST